MVKVRCRCEPEYTHMRDTKDPLVLFDLASIGVSEQQFIEFMASSYEKLEWDYYDVRREHLAIIQEQVAVPAPAALEYYAGSIPLEALLARLPALEPDLRARMEAVSPYRRRSTAKLKLARENGNGTWRLERMPNNPIQQSVEVTDYRSLPRKFKETSIEILENEDFNVLVRSLANLVTDADPTVRELALTCWVTGIVARPHRAGSNSPEGIHQDGADFIVSALVLERKNIAGGTSRVFASDKTTTHLEVTLGAGQGIFQADAGSSLWHDVTPIRLEDPAQNTGVRNILGFDINVLART